MEKIHICQMLIFCYLLSHLNHSILWMMQMFGCPYFTTVHGVKYAFGAHDYPTSGVFEVEARQCPSFKFRKSIFMGTTSLDPIEVIEFMERRSANYNGDTYHLIAKNYNNFCDDICYKLTGNPMPKWVNRLARMGELHPPYHSLYLSLRFSFKSQMIQG